MLYVRTNTGLDQTGNRLSFEAQARDGAPPSEDDKRKHTVECGPKRALRILRILQSFSFRPLLSCRACHVTPRLVLLFSPAPRANWTKRPPPPPTPSVAILAQAFGLGRLAGLAQDPRAL